MSKGPRPVSQVLPQVWLPIQPVRLGQSLQCLVVRGFRRVHSRSAGASPCMEESESCGGWTWCRQQVRHERCDRRTAERWSIFNTICRFNHTHTLALTLTFVCWFIWGISFISQNLIPPPSPPLSAGKTDYEIKRQYHPPPNKQKGKKKASDINKTHNKKKKNEHNFFWIAKHFIVVKYSMHPSITILSISHSHQWFSTS